MLSICVSESVPLGPCQSALDCLTSMRVNVGWIVHASQPSLGQIYVWCAYICIITIVWFCVCFCACAASLFLSPSLSTLINLGSDSHCLLANMSNVLSFLVRLVIFHCSFPIHALPWKTRWQLENHKHCFNLFYFVGNFWSNLITCIYVFILTQVPQIPFNSQQNLESHLWPELSEVLNGNFLPEQAANQP